MLSRRAMVSLSGCFVMVALGFVLCLEILSSDLQAIIRSLSYDRLAHGSLWSVRQAKKGNGIRDTNVHINPTFVQVAP